MNKSQKYCFSLKPYFYLPLIIFALTTEVHGLDKPEDYLNLAFMAGSSNQCGVSREESIAALKKIEFVLSCKAKTGEIKQESLNKFLKLANNQYNKGKENPPNYPANVCESVSYLIRELNKISKC